ncbi:alanine racemase [Flavobacterium agricola]|uniref:Alanine racemase n=1 Tax=Flavobacterium agricola TaxID=2870839 RepID=A0ABY6M1L0_9FLAO|nr:alanine racemase [Flavobacterium agricola]UYW02399.1 alanine racemase [Flavobacterium agricola]
MAYIILHQNKLKHNFDYLEQFFKSQNVNWSVVAKILCGHKKYLELLLSFNVNQVCDSRITNLKTIKQINPQVKTFYIKPPAKTAIADVIKYADVSFNSDLYTIQLLNDAAKKQNKTHQVILMIDLGELREGIMREDFLDFYDKLQTFSNIQVLGIGTNLSCLYGVLPNTDKLNQLDLYKQLVEAKFNQTFPYISGGSSVTMPLLANGLLPSAINHFRIGETLFMGTNAYAQEAYDFLEQNVFELRAEIIELYEKPIVPSGELGANLEGETPSFDENDLGKTSFRALVDIGLLDVDINHVTPADLTFTIEAGTSDMTVLDLGKNEAQYKVGDTVRFHLDYMGIVRIMNSKYIDKVIE